MRFKFVFILWIQAHSSLQFLDLSQDPNLRSLNMDIKISRLNNRVLRFERDFRENRMLIKRALQIDPNFKLNSE